MTITKVHWLYEHWIWCFLDVSLRVDWTESIISFEWAHININIYTYNCIFSLSILKKDFPHTNLIDTSKYRKNYRRFFRKVPLKKVLNTDNDLEQKNQVSKNGLIKLKLWH